MVPTVIAVRVIMHSVCCFTHSITKARTEAEMIALRNSLGSVAEAEMVTEEIEMGFVPASERQHTTSGAADTVITVGQRSQQKKKRKRNLASNEPEDDVEMFDYTAEPSLLDVGDMKQVGPVAKRRNKGKRLWCSLEIDSDTLARTRADAVRKLPSTSTSVQPTQER